MMKKYNRKKGDLYTSTVSSFSVFGSTVAFVG